MAGCHRAGRQGPLGLPRQPKTRPPAPMRRREGASAPAQRAGLACLGQTRSRSHDKVTAPSGALLPLECVPAGRPAATSMDARVQVARLAREPVVVVVSPQEDHSTFLGCCQTAGEPQTAPKLLVHPGAAKDWQCPRYCQSFLLTSCQPIGCARPAASECAASPPRWQRTSYGWPPWGSPRRPWPSRWPGRSSPRRTQHGWR